MPRPILSSLVTATALTGFSAPADAAAGPGVPDQAELRKQAARFATVAITADLSALPDGEKRVLAKLVEAARLMDTLFLRQDWAQNESFLLALAEEAASGSPLARARLHAFLV